MQGANRVAARARGPFALVLLSAALLSGCGGPNEKAGEERDKASASASGIPYSGNGPNQQIGKAQDRAADAARDARDAQAASLREQARTIKAQADVEADRLDQQAQAIRDQAKARAAPLETQAQDLRDRK